MNAWKKVSTPCTELDTLDLALHRPAGPYSFLSFTRRTA